MNSGLLSTVHMQCEQWSTRRRRRRKGRGRRLACSGSLVATRRFGRWLSRLRWREWWPVSVASKGRRKVAEERGSVARSLYEVVRQFLVMEMEVFKLVVTMLVAERRGGERERFYWQQKPSVGGWFFCCLLTKISPPLEHENKPIYRRWKRDTLSLLVPNISLD
jgi:hypothetical protein